jgi:V8-like Glu-specific endopeptidase
MKKVLFFLLVISSIAYGQDEIRSITSQNQEYEGNNTPVKIGDVIPTNLHTTHPYHSTGQGGVVFEQEFTNKHSSYIKIYFKDFNLAPGDYVEITAVNTGESILYGGQGKIIDNNLTMISDFWSQVLFDERVIVRLHAQTASNYYGFEIEKVAYGYPQNQIDQIWATKAICGQDDKEPVICYNGTNMYDKGRAVCKLIIGGGGSCTGWLLGCDGHVMTNNHCIGTASEAANTDFIFNYHNTNCNGTGNSTSNTVSAASTLIKTNGTLDYTLVQLPVNPTSTYGYLSLSSVAPVVSDRIYIVGHPGGRRKEITVVTDLNGDASGNAIVNTVTANGIRYMADTEGGSSGSPVFDYNSNLVVAIHNTGGCTNGASGRSDRLITDIGIDMPNCGIDSSVGLIPALCAATIVSFPYIESFENTFGLWTQDTIDDFDWTALSGATATTNTGPTTANDGTFYAYMEASSPNSPSKNAILRSPCFDLTGLSYPELIFNYHMFGINTGVLRVEVTTNYVTWTTLWTKTGSQGNSWMADTIDLSAYAASNNLIVRFNGTTANGDRSDIAIDAFSIQSGTPTCSVINTFPYSESFENSLGAWVQDSNDDFDWTILSGATPSTGTGPTASSDGSYYLYMEASNPNNPSKKAILTSPCFDLTGISNPELIFDYHLFGANVGDLDVEISTNGGAWASIWTKSGDQGDSWTTTIVNLATYTNVASLRLRFNGVIGSNWESDIAIDAVSIVSSLSCLTTVNSFPYTESFENGTGDWMQEGTDAIDWTILSGATPSNNTGPTSASNGTRYAYIEASDPNNPSKIAKLRSPCFDLTGITDPELSFDYHMFGANMGTLRLEARIGTSFIWFPIWTLSGDQGNSWQTATIDLSNYTNATDLIVQITGITGSDYDSDMAIDGLSITSVTTTDIKKSEEDNSFLSIAPNPFKDYLVIETNIQGISDYSISNIQGQVVQTGNLNNKYIQLKSLSQGVYFISFTNGQEHITRKIIKQ